ncbi:hypothetical protein EKK58_06145 [Candidatus Dependentiae bacterium]|nr:MAG: hypothetical protein EKK58_06145 [Candidatus Dependentiae bacterium]
MTIQEQCAERIYELLPEKKELSFGCYVRNTGDSDSEYGIVCMTSLGLVHIIEKINDCEDTFWQKKTKVSSY